MLQGGRAPPAPQRASQLRLAGVICLRVQHQPELPQRQLRRQGQGQAQEGAAEACGRGGWIGEVGPEQQRIGPGQAGWAGQLSSGWERGPLQRDAVIGQPALQLQARLRGREQQRAAGQRPLRSGLRRRQRQPATLNQEIDGPGRALIGLRLREHPFEGLARQTPQPEALDPAQQLTVAMQHQVGQHEGSFLTGPHLQLTGEAIRQRPGAELQRSQPHRQQQRAALSAGIQGRRHRLEAGIEQAAVCAALLAAQAHPGPITKAVQPLQLAVGGSVLQAPGRQGAIEGLQVEFGAILRSITRQPGQAQRCGLPRAQNAVVEPLRRSARTVEAEAAAGRAPEQLQAHRGAVPLQPQRLVQPEGLQPQRLPFTG